MRLRPLALAITALALAGCARGGADPSPPAAPAVVSVVQDDAELLHRPPARIAATLDDLRDSGVDWVRVTAGWSVIAPEPGVRRKPSFDATDPDAYPPGAWEALDRVARLTAARGMRLAVDIAFWAPRWAVERPGERADRERDGVRPADLADFAEAVARRYPQAAAFTVWNEPNHNAFLLPQWERVGGAWRPASPHAYRAMIEAVVPRLKVAAPHALALIGATSSVGAAHGDEPGNRMSPLTFLRELACVDEELRPLDRPECAGFTALPGDGWSHHPYALELPPWASDPRPETARIGDLGRLATLLERLHAAGRTQRRLPLYLTEFGYQTNPPDPTWEVTAEEQARWLPEAERVARAEPSVRATAQFLVRDLPERAGPDPATRWRDYQSGLRFEDGRPKPAHAAYALGLVALRDGSGVRFWALVRPGRGARTARIAVEEPDGSWRTLVERQTAADGTMATTVDVDPARTFRLESGGRTGPPLRGARQPG
jgi:hypothetical protein